MDTFSCPDRTLCGYSSSSLPFTVFLHVSVGVGASSDKDGFSSGENTSDKATLELRAWLA
jgi:hypothetical protein